jgi:hypothetical protein
VQVKALWDGHRVTGLYVGVRNVRRYFPKSMQAIELQLDHLQIRCGLQAHFWKGRPEIHDPRLCLWLELKQMQGKGCRSMAMIPSGQHSFILTSNGAFGLSHSVDQPSRSSNWDRRNIIGEDSKLPKDEARNCDADSNLG